MKRLKKIFYTALTLCLFLAAAFPVSARGEEYTYTVRFFAGKQGSFADGEMMVFEGLHYGDRINFYQSAVKLNDNSKYYIRGIRESGKDNSESTQTSSFVVTGDRDYVVAYGILGDATSYTVNHVDSQGNTLAPSETYYGNVGDRPVVAYIYIEGWTPQAYNMTQTLKKDPAENVFDFVYTRTVQETIPQPPAPVPEQPGEPAVPVPAEPSPGIVVIPAPEIPTGQGADVGGDNTNTPDNPGTPDDPGNPDDGGEDPEGQVVTDPDIPQGGPDEIVNMDEEEIPTSIFPFIGSDARLLGIPIPVVIIGVMGIVGVTWYFLFMKRRKQKKAEQEDKAG